MQGSLFYSVRRLAWLLGVPVERLRALADHPHDHYRSWESRSGRGLTDPSDELKQVQRLIRERILVPEPLPDCMHGCVKGRSPLSNASQHLGKRNLAKIDLKSFFPSVTNRMVFDIYRAMGFGPSPARLLTMLTTYKGHLPQGAPTSDRLAALAVAPFVAQLERVLRARGLGFTVFVDDFAISGDDARDAMNVVISEIVRAGFAVGRRKTFSAGAKRAHTITGYNVDSARGPSVGRRDRRQARAAVSRLIQSHASGKGTERLESSVRGTLAYLRRTNPGEVRRLERQLRAEYP